MSCCFIDLCVFLDPFDYYFFHFSYHLINPWHQRSVAPFGASWNTVYYSLCCDYVLHFLPTDPSCPVLPVISFYCGKNPIQQLPSFNKYDLTCPEFTFILQDLILLLGQCEHLSYSDLNYFPTV